MGSEQPDVAQGLTKYARVLDKPGDQAAAEAGLRDAVRIRKKAFGDRNPDTARSMIALGLNLSLSGAHIAESRGLLQDGAGDLAPLVVEADRHVKAAREALTALSSRR